LDGQGAHKDGRVGRLEVQGSKRTWRGAGSFQQKQSKKETRMIDIMELKRQKAKILDEANALLDKATTEKRNLTLSEEQRHRESLTKVDELNRQITMEDRKQAAEMANGHPYDAPGGGRKDKNIYLADEDRAFLKYIRKGVAGLTSDESRALVEDSTGDFLVSPAIDDELHRTVEKLVVIRQLASIRTTDKDRILVRSIDEPTVSWGKLETGAEIDESTPTPSEVTKYVEDLNGLVKIGKDELEDSDYDLVTYLANAFGRAIAEKENLGFLKGAGHGSNEPDGITLDATLVAATKTTAAAGVVTIDDFLQCIYEVPPKYRQGSAWLFNSTLELAIRKLRAEVADGFYGNYLWQPSLIAGSPPTFLGYPVYSQDDMDDLTDTAGVIACFGNFQFGYRIVDRKEVTIQRLVELYAESGLVGFLVHARTTGYLLRPSNKALVLLTEHSA
jgi:HK97 family phage major capsid protein